MIQYSAMRLGNGSRVAVLGGGPAGSFFALYLLRYAAMSCVDLHVDIFEWRSFSDLGPKGCNRGAGILSASMLRNLKELELSVPEEVIRSRITSYHLHSPFGIIDIANPDPSAEIYSVFRGAGPLYNSVKLPGFDGFLLDKAVEQGAGLVRRRVDAVKLAPRPTVVVEDGSPSYDLVVLATGLNSGSVEISGVNYRPPASRTMSQDELYAREEDIQEYFGSSVRAFFLPKTDLIFASVVPKGSFLSVSLLSRGGPADLEGFLEHEIVKKAIPFPYKRSCGCRPRIGVGCASGFFADGFVAVGDAAVSRLYKDGIGSALLTARHAAFTAVSYGTSANDFRNHYLPYCRGIQRDNQLGRLIFAIHNRTKDSGRFFRAQSRLINPEGSMSVAGQAFSKILWGIFTGSYNYREIWHMASRGKVIARMALEYLRGA